MATLTLYALFFVLLVAIAWRLRQRKGRIGTAAVGSVYDMLNEGAGGLLWRYFTPLANPYWLFSWQTYSISSSPG